MITPRQEHVTIVSVWPLTAFNTQRAHGTFEMEGCPICKTPDGVTPKHLTESGHYSTLRVTDRKESRDIGNDEHVDVIVNRYDLANDLVSLAPHLGVFAIEGDEPTEEELEAARTKLRAWAGGPVEEADRIWQVKRDPARISATAHVCAKMLGQRREWMTDTAPKRVCAGCGEFISPDAARCRCGAVIDYEKARDLLLLTEREESIAISRGLLKPLEEEAAAVRPGRKRAAEASG